MTEAEFLVDLDAARRDAVRRLRDRDAAWADIDGLRAALGLKIGEGLTLAELTACVQAINLTGDPVARAEELSALVRQLETENAELRARLAVYEPPTPEDDEEP